ncbi:MAG: hypothetical protein RJA81_2293 [Planctomycetota bacterium]
MPETDSDPVALKESIRNLILAKGFDAVGFASPVQPPGYPHYLDWLAQGCHGEMAYMEKQAEARNHPNSILPAVGTVIVTLLNYHHGRPSAKVSGEKRNSGHVASYAQGQDYHRIFWDRLGQVLDQIKVTHPEITGRAVADSAPLMERDYARLAGLGWIGKNTCLINRKIGSFTLLGALLINLQLPPDEPFEADHCGTCTRCLDACPTSALDSAYRLDARKCISYWTIEHKGLLPDEVTDHLNGWVFGCDICQDVCPWNRKAILGKDQDLMGDGRFFEPDLREWLKMNPDDLKKQISGTALERTRRRGLVRNAIAVLSSESGDGELMADLIRLETDDTDQIIRESARLAIKKLQERNHHVSETGNLDQSNEGGPF